MSLRKVSSLAAGDLHPNILLGLPRQVAGGMPTRRWVMGLGLVAVFCASAASLYARTYVFGRTDYIVGSAPFAVVAADFNGDGILDLAVANAGDKTITILLGRRDGTFGAGTIYATGVTPVAIAVGDFNGDGVPDLAVATSDCQFVDDFTECGYGSVSVFIGVGDGTFLPAVNYAAPSGYLSIATGDFNRDGKLDLVVSNGGTLALLLGNGDGTFQSQVQFSTNRGSSDLVVGDFNGDGNLDVALANGTILLGNGNGTFQPAGQIGVQGYSIAAGDFNGDGILDLAIGGEYSGDARILLGNGDGTFTPFATYADSVIALVADLNGDGKLDLIEFGTDQFDEQDATDSVQIQLGNGDGTFQPPLSYGTGLGSTTGAIADLNGDGIPDLVTVNPGCYIDDFYCSSNTISVLLGLGNGGFVAQTQYPSGYGSVYLADYTGDGEPDVVTTAPNVIAVLPGNGDGTFQAPITTPISQYGYWMVPGDFNNDGKQDVALVFPNSSGPGMVGVFLGNGDGTFQQPIASTVGLKPEYLTAADFNHDGNLDLAVTNYDANTVSILLGNGDGTFQTHHDYPTPQMPYVVMAADLNLDGIPDLVVTSSAGTSIFLGNGDGTFRARVDYPFGVADSVAIGDVNNDGFPDLVFSSYDSNNVVVSLGNGDGTFRTPTTIVGPGGDRLKLADFTGDGKLDLVLGHADAGPEAWLYTGGGDGTFENPTNYLAGMYWIEDLAAFDLNGDGAPDLVTTDQSGFVGVILSAAFIAVTPHELNFGSQGVGTGSAPQNIAVSNPSNVALSLGNIGTTGPFSQSNNCPASLSPGGTCTISATFAPQATGPQSGAVTIANSARNSPTMVALSGTGVSGMFVTLSPTLLNFAPQNVGTMGNAVPVQVMNTGNAPVTINSIGFTGGAQGDFQQTNNCGNSLPTGGSCTVNITFSPMVGGVRTANLAIGDSAPGSPQTALLRGIGLAANNTLTVTVGPGGYVTSTDGFINCPGVCTHTYPANMQVTLNTTPWQQWQFQSWEGACSQGPCTLTMTQDQSVQALFNYYGPVLQFTPLMPCRVIDTRRPNGPFGGPAFSSGEMRTYEIDESACSVPEYPQAAVYSMNVTVVPRQPLNYLTIWTAYQPQPTVSTLNSPDGRVKANAFVVEGPGISIYVTDATDVIVDINGYFGQASSQTAQFYPLTPCRVIDTRGATGDLGGPYLMAQQERDFPVLESSCIPSGVNISAYSMNFTVVPHTAGQPLGYLTVWPLGEMQPGVSTLNNPKATVVANAAIVPAGTNGEIATYPYNDTDLIVDINGYFAAPGQGYSFYTVPPCRVYDSRANNGQPFTGERTVIVATSPCPTPISAAAFVFNATVVPSGSLGYLTLWPDGGPQPGVSTLNAYDGFITSDMAIVPNMNGSTDAFAAPGYPGAGSGYTQLILDISGYFAP